MLWIGRLYEHVIYPRLVLLVPVAVDTLLMSSSLFYGLIVTCFFHKHSDSIDQGVHTLNNKDHGT